MINKNILPIDLFFPSKDMLRSFSIGMFKIRKITKEERANFFGVESVIRDSEGRLDQMSFVSAGQQNSIFSTILNDLQLMRLNSVDYVIEFEKEPDEHREELRLLLFSLKIYISNNYFAPLVFDGVSTISVYEHPQYDAERCVKINKSDLRKIRKIFNTLKNVKDDKFDIIREKYNFAINQRTSSKSSFIELASILEALFLDGTNQELSFRLSLIVSYIINKNHKTKYNFNWFKNIYDIRSKLVHTGKCREYNNDIYEDLKVLTSKLILLYFSKNISYEKTKNEFFKILRID